MGYVVRAHGLRGQLRVHSDSVLLRIARQVFVAEREYEVVAAQPLAKGYLLKLQGVDDRDQAARLQGTTVSLPREQLPPLESGEVYVADLTGCQLVDLGGIAIGEVQGTQNTGAQELLVVALPSGREALVPLVEPIVQSIDLAARRIVCDLPEGLLEL